MNIVDDDIWLCSDCVSPAVNDDYTALDYYYSEPKATERMEEIQAGLSELGNIVPDFDDEHGVEMCKRSCDCCGIRHFGEFHHFIKLGE